MIFFVLIFEREESSKIESEEVARYLIKKFGHIDDCQIVIDYNKINNQSEICNINLVVIITNYQTFSQRHFDDFCSFLKEKDPMVAVVGDRVEEAFDFCPN